MAILYNCKHDGDQYRITKFNENLEVESSYLCTETECECPAGVRPMCRHREMLPRFIARDEVGSGWMYDYDRGGWVQMFEDDPPPLPEGVVAVSLEYPKELYNAIANALCETVIPDEPEAVTGVASSLNTEESEPVVTQVSTVTTPGPRYKRR